MGGVHTVYRLGWRGRRRPPSWFESDLSLSWLELELFVSFFLLLLKSINNLTFIQIFVYKILSSVVTYKSPGFIPRVTKTAWRDCSHGEFLRNQQKLNSWTHGSVGARLRQSTLGEH